MRLRARIVLGACALVACGAICVAAALRYAKTSKGMPHDSNAHVPLDAQIVRVDAVGSEVIHVEDPRDLVDLEWMFPDYRKLPQHGATGNAKSKFEVVIRLKDGSVRRMDVYEQDRRLRWTCGNGDVAVRGSLELFIAALPAGRLVHLLTSRSPTERAAAKRQLESHGDELIGILVRSLNSDSEAQQQEAARRLELIVSPWSRRRFTLYSELPDQQIDRNLVRPVEHSRADEIRVAIIAALQSILANTEAKATVSSRVGAFLVLCRCLGEVGDQSTAGDLAKMLAKERRLRYSMPMTDCLELIYGLPPFEDKKVWHCPVGESQLTLDRWAKEAENRHSEAKRKMLSWHRRYASHDREEQIRAAVLKWEDRLFVPEVSSSSDRQTGMGRKTLSNKLAQQFARPRFDRRKIVQSLTCVEPLVRIGLPVLPVIKQRQSATQDEFEKAVWELIATYLSGHFDEPFVRQEMQGSDVHRAMAQAIIAVSDLPTWNSED